MVNKKTKKESKIKCFYCSNPVNLKKDYHVLLGTYNRPKNQKEDEAFFHFECFKEWYNSKIQKQVEARLSFIQDKTMAVLNSPMMHNMIEKIATKVETVQKNEQKDKGYTVIKSKKNGKRKTSKK